MARTGNMYCHLARWMRFGTILGNLGGIGVMLVALAAIALLNDVVMWP